MSEPLYEVCPSCWGKGTLLTKLGRAPDRVDAIEPCPTCATKGFVHHGLTVEAVEELQIKAAAHDLILRWLIRGPSRLPDLPPESVGWVIRIPSISFAFDSNHGSFMEARDALYEAIGLRGAP